MALENTLASKNPQLIKRSQDQTKVTAGFNTENPTYF